MSIVITTPTGNTGRVVVEKLLEAGRTDVAVIARHPDKLAPEVRARVTVHAGDQFDEAVVLRATENADALFWLTPPNFTTPDWKVYYEQSATVASRAVTTNHIPCVVHLSSGGADQPAGRGPVSLLNLVETALANTGANVLHLRPGYFYENFLGNVETIKTQGTIYSPVPAEVSYPMIATQDIGAIAAAQLQSRDWSGEAVLGLHGPAEQPTFGQAAQIISDAIGKPIQYVVVPMEAVRQQFLQMGASPSVADAYTELLGSLARGEQASEPRTPETTTPTTLADWTREEMRPLVQG